MTVPRAILRTLVVVLCLWLGGFVLFLSRLDNPLPEAESADAAVVLTGGPGRIEAATALLKEGRVGRLLISGVNREVRREELAETAGIDPDLLGCCIDLDYGALDTLGNARQSALWAERRGYDSLIVVTARDHLPRALFVFRRALPDVRIGAVTVKSQRNPVGLAREFTKYVFTLLRLRI